MLRSNRNHDDGAWNRSYDDHKRNRTVCFCFTMTFTPVVTTGHYPSSQSSWLCVSGQLHICHPVIGTCVCWSHAISDIPLHFHNWHAIVVGACTVSGRYRSDLSLYMTTRVITKQPTVVNTARIHERTWQAWSPSWVWLTLIDRTSITHSKVDDLPHLDHELNNVLICFAFSVYGFVRVVHTMSIDGHNHY